MASSSNDDSMHYISRVVDHIPGMVAYWDRDLRCRFANRAYETWFGVAPDRLIGTTLPQLLGPELFVQNRHHIEAALDGQVQLFERVVPGPDGVRRQSLANYVPDVIEGEVVGFVAIVTDVAKVKAAEANLHALIASLEAEIAKRRDAESNLVDVQESLAVTLDSIDAAFLATDRHGAVTRMNPAAERLLGWSQQEARGHSVWEVFVRVGRDEAQVLRNPIDVMIEQAITVDATHQVEVMSRDGRRTTVEAKADLIRAQDGSVRGIAMVLRDMTASMRAAGESNRLAAIVESSHDAIIAKTLDGRITSWNAAAEAIFGYSAEEAIGQFVQMLIPADRQGEEMRILAELARGVRVPAFETLRRTRNGRLIDVAVTISPIRDAAGRIVGASKIARDITPQRRAEAALRASEARLRFTLESAQIGDWEIDLKSLVMSRSLQHDRCFGYARAQPAWSFHILLRHVHPDDRSAVSASFDAALARGADWRIECRVVWPDASVHWIALHGSLHHEAPPARRMLGIVSDITQRKLADEARYELDRLEAENRQIQEATRLKSLFLANMSHELRTPLNAIIGFADLLHSGTVRPDSPKHRSFLGHIATSGRHLLQLINDVLDLSKVESGKFEFFPEPLDLPLLVKEVNDVLRTSIDRKRITSTADIDPGLTDLQLDTARLKQVLYNLLSNAIKFTGEGGAVTVRARAQGDSHLRIEVEDNGIGIAADQLPRLFTEFQQLDSGYTKRHEGTGLGLALTRRLVEAQGGTVGVRSEPGVGSVFHVVLNRVHGTDAARAAVGTPRPADIAEHHLLVIEDDRQVQARMVQALLRAGFQVQPASNSDQALHFAAIKGFDALTLDLLLPGNGGLQLLDSIRSGGASAQSPVLAVNVPTSAGSAASFAIDNILCKPIRGDEVLAAMARFRLPVRGRANVLVIDDDPVALDLMRATLAGIGIDAVCQQDGRQALQEIGLHRPDAIILDLMMPGFDGFAVLDALQRLPPWDATPVFIWTSMILTDEEYRSLSRSAQAIIGKGGGALAVMLERLRQWRPATVTALPLEGEP